MEARSPRVIGFRLTANPQSEAWQTPIATSDLSVLLIGWITDVIPIDAGVPTEAAELLSAALTRLAVVTFFAEAPECGRIAPNRWIEYAGGWAAVLTRTNAVLPRGRPLPLIATEDAGVAQQLFQSGSFNWNQQAQAGLLSEPGHPPTVAYDSVEKCVRRENIPEVMRELGLVGIVYPAVDGDFAALVSDGATFAGDFLRELERACEAAQIPFTIVSEDEFRDTRWMQ